MLISVFSPKGGVGTSTVAALFSKALSQVSPTLLVDCASGDLNGIVGVDTYKYGFEDWAISGQPTLDSLVKICTPVVENLNFVGSVNTSDLQDLNQDSSCHIADLLSSSGNVVVDCGHARELIQQKILDASDLVVVVFRQCYLGMLRASTNEYCTNADVCVVIKESGRSIKTSQLASSLKVQVVIEIEARADFAKAIDAGVVINRPPEKMISAIKDFVRDLQVKEESIQDEYRDFWQVREESDLRGRFLLPEKYSNASIARIRGNK